MKVWKFKEEHIIERISERARYFKDGIDANAELRRIKEALEENVPEDWRLTRFSGDFLIRDIKLGITLLGHQMRKEGSTAVIKYVNTALASGGFSKGKLGKHSGDPNAFEIAKRPNLFIGDESFHEIYKISPVLARQYEKVYYRTLETEFKSCDLTFTRTVQAKSPIEFLRLNPLTPSGIDHNNYIWSKWVATKGYFTFMKGNPPKEYHGEDFWLLETE